MTITVIRLRLLGQQGPFKTSGGAWLDIYTIDGSKIKNYKWTKLDEFDCSELYTIVIGKKGKLTDVLMTEYQTKESIKEFWDTKREYNHCIKSIKKALSELQFDILKRKGEPTVEKVYIEVWFNKDGTIENWSD